MSWKIVIVGQVLCGSYARQNKEIPVFKPRIAMRFCENKGGGVLENCLPQR